MRQVYDMNYLGLKSISDIMKVSKGIYVEIWRTMNDKIKKWDLGVEPSIEFTKREITEGDNVNPNIM